MLYSGLTEKYAVGSSYPHLGLKIFPGVEALNRAHKKDLTIIVSNG